MPSESKEHCQQPVRLSSAFETRTFILLHVVSAHHNDKNNLWVNLHFKEQVLNEILDWKIENQRAIETTKKSNEGPVWSVNEKYVPNYSRIVQSN